MPRVAEPKEDEPIRLFMTKRYGPRYRCVLRVGTDRKQVTHTASTLKAAREWVVSTRAADFEGRALGPCRLTLNELANRWLTERKREVGTTDGIREVTYNGYESALSGPLLHMGTLPVGDISMGDVRSLMTTLATKGGARGRPLSRRSVQYALGTLRQVFNYGVENRLVASNPAIGVAAPKRRAGDVRETRIWTPAELMSFRAFVDAKYVGLAADAEPAMRAALRLTMCGLRRSEVLGLDWAQVSLVDGVVRVCQGRVETGRGTKTVTDLAKSDDSVRSVPVESMHSGTASALRELWVAQGQPASGLVVLTASGDPIRPDAFSRRFRALCADASLPDLGSIHNIRHTIATALHDSGVEPRKAASLLGHKVATHLAFYVPNSDDAAVEAATAAGAIFADSRTA
ncbi:unannotated protein [freshwater metagenome]|uniref:Unannotated protein n=1 Tax=freshwater metagenome TaxID=449393 RepID=A0A6J7HXV1_9ZZZZ|nr:tyrosine-type recombinase/integrase [Actinomycetota bacterium]